MSESEVSNYTWEEYYQIMAADRVIQGVTFGILFFGEVMEIACLILFLWNFKLQNPLFCSAYFYLLTIGYFLNIFANLSFILSYALPDTFIQNAIDSTLQIYYMLFAGPWNTVLALNRFTAVLFWKYHARIWSTPLHFRIILILLFLYPFIVNGHNYANFSCFKDIFASRCKIFFLDTETITAISNGINVLVALGLGIITALSRRLKLQKDVLQKQKFENHLLIQSLISSLLFGSFCLASFISARMMAMAVNATVNEYILSISLLGVANCTYMIFHFSSTILLFILS